jgi:predicted metal-dependent enzyme (double-stranded beta helix superfamily)
MTTSCPVLEPTLSDFPGRQALIDAVDAAVAHDGHEAIGHALAQSLERLIRSGTLQLPPAVLQPTGDHYARRLLYRSPSHGYVVIAMTWGSGQGTPIHDHDGMWGVEGVCHGHIEVIPQRVTACHGDHWRFEAQTPILAGVGATACVFPHADHHVIRNADTDGVAVSLHIYEHDMTCCGVYLEQPDGSHLLVRKQLRLDAAA